MSTLPPEPEILLRETAWLRRVACDLVGDKAAAEDLVQDTWLAAIHRDPAAGNPSKAWLRGVVRNLAAMRYRSNARRRARERASAAAEHLPGADELVARLEIQRRLTEAVAQLDKDSRVIVLLRFQEELSPTQIAERLDLPQGTVRSRLSRALHKLRKQLAAQEQDLRPLLAPLLHWRLGQTEALAAESFGTLWTTLETTAMKKTLFAVVGLLICLGVWWLQPLGRFESLDPEGKSAQSKLVLATQPAMDEAELHVQPQAPIVRTELAHRYGFGTTAGWWVEGLVRTPMGLGGKEATVTIRAANKDIATVIQGVSDTAGRVEIDVSPIFRHERESVKVLQVDIDHPDYLPRRTTIEVGREQRQAGFRQERSRLPFEIDLLKTTAHMTGKIRVPSGCPLESVQVAIVQRHPGNRPGRLVIDVTSPDSQGAFSLRASDSAEHFVVAWIHGGLDLLWTLRPKHELVRAGRLEGIELVLDEGYVVTGRLVAGNTGNTQADGYRLRTTARAEIDAVRNGYAEDGVEQNFGGDLPGLEEFGMTVVQPIPTAVTGKALPLLWAGDAFEHAEVQAYIDGGRVRFPGLRPGAKYNIPGVEVLADSATVPAFGGGLRNREFRASNEDLQLRLPRGLALLELSQAAEPVVTSHLLVQEIQKSKAWRLRRTNTQGRVAIWFNPTDAAYRIDLCVAGCLRLSTTPIPYRWTPVALQQYDDIGSLEIQIAGDTDRRVEGFGIRIRRQTLGRFGLAEFGRDSLYGRRMTDNRVIEGLQAGLLRIELFPDRRRRHCDFFSFYCPAIFDVQIHAGTKTRHVVQLQPGGFAQLLDLQKLYPRTISGAKGLFYSLRDSQGVPIATRAINAKPDVVTCEIPHQTTRRLPKTGPIRFYPVLPQGSYTLELWQREGQVATKHAFTITAGKVTSIGAE